jgi:gluconate 2-dehydrogenase gamma chain
MSRLSRRDVVAATGAAAAAALGSAPPEAAAQQPRAAQPTTYLFFNADEVAFVEAAIARLFPADVQWPGAQEAGVANFIDKELNGAWGAGERLYRSGPWQPGTPPQGYQLPFTPAELFRTALAAITRDLARAGTPFAKMTAEQQDAYLRGLEAGGKDLRGVPSATFFSQLLDATVEGFFSDPVYGGNRDMVAWKMIGFPGAYASYYDLVDQHGLRLDRAPTSLAEDSHGHVHVNPAIPARQR